MSYVAAEDRIVRAHVPHRLRHTNEIADERDAGITNPVVFQTRTDRVKDQPKSVRYRIQPAAPCTEFTN